MAISININNNRCCLFKNIAFYTADHVNLSDIFTYLTDQFERNTFFRGGMGNIKAIYPVNSEGLSCDGQSKCLALALTIEKNDNKSKSLIENEVRLLHQLHDAGLPVVPLYHTKEGPQSIHLQSQNEYGYLMEWIPNAVQIEAKTAEKSFNLKVLSLIILGLGKTITSTDFGRVNTLNRFIRLLSETHRINQDILSNLITDLQSIHAYPEVIIDLQILIDSQTGHAVIIDPMDILDNNDNAFDESPELEHFRWNTRHWLDTMLAFLTVVQLHCKTSELESKSTDQSDVNFICSTISKNSTSPTSPQRPTSIQLQKMAHRKIPFSMTQK